MSVEQMALVLNKSRATGTAKLVLLNIANHDGDGGAWPSQATLARYANCTDRTVRNAITELVALGELIVHPREGGTRQTDPRHRPNLYEITLSTGPNHDRKVASSRKHSRPETGGDCDRKQVSAEPSLEPSSTETPADLTAVPLSPADYFQKHTAEHPRVARWLTKDEGPL